MDLSMFISKEKKRLPPLSHRKALKQNPQNSPLSHSYKKKIKQSLIPSIKKNKILLQNLDFFKQNTK